MKKEQPLSWAGIVKGVKEEFKKNKTAFSGSIDWYCVSVKLDMEAHGLIKTEIIRSMKMHRLQA